MRGRLVALLAPLLLLAAADDTTAVVSSAPRSVAVTVYRNPYRGRDDELQLDWLGGFALVTEMRDVSVPAGRATIRFEGVASGIVPASAIVTGLPGGVIEKNRDARLLSPAALIDGSLGRRVTLTRTDRKSGEVRVRDAVIVAGPVGGVVVRTREGVEALGCSGLAEKPVYAAVPAGLSSAPVLSVETRSQRATTARVTLSYLSSEFDWAASYVATIAPDGRHLDLFAWLTLANGNRESFPDADLQAVAGRLNYANQRLRTYTQPLRLDCYPLGTTTSDLKTIVAQDIGRFGDIVVTGMRLAAPPPPPPPPAPQAPPAPEDLGDLKLYRVPERVTVRAHGEKQVALLTRARVPFERRYRATVPAGAALDTRPTAIVLRLRNDAAAGLGVPLPAGATAVYAAGGASRLLLGTGGLNDHAVGEAVRLAAGTSSAVQVRQAFTAAGRATVTVSNANAAPITAEIAIDAPPGRIRPARGRLVELEGRPTWVISVPANGEASLDYAIKP